MEGGRSPFNGAVWMQASVKSLSSLRDETFLLELVLKKAGPYAGSLNGTKLMECRPRRAVHPAPPGHPSIWRSRATPPQAVHAGLKEGVCPTPG